MTKLNLRVFNNLLSAVVITVGLYLIATPWVPNLELWWNQRTKETPVYVSSTLSGVEKSDRPEDSIDISFPTENRLIIPSIALDSEVFQGGTSVLNRGPWKRPNTSTPLDGGNTVIAGHRFSYGTDGKWIFYHLDKIKVGDRIGMYWEGTEYIYEVNRTHIVEPTAIEIEADTDKDQLTLYTCTPLWTAAQRLVVVADLIETNRSTDEI